MSKLLLQSYPLVIIPELAVKIGLNESIIIQQLHYWLNKSNHEYDQVKWIYNSIREWHEQFPFLSQRTIERAMAELKKKGLIITANYNKMKADRTLWYSIDYEKLDKLTDRLTAKPNRQNDEMATSNCQDHNDKMGEAIPENTTENTTENTSQSFNQNEPTIEEIFEKSQVDMFEDTELKATIKQAIKELHRDMETRQIIKRVKIEHITDANFRYKSEISAGKQITKPLEYYKKILINCIIGGGFGKLEL